MKDSERRIAELEAKVKSLENNLIHDQLTGLKTRSFFEEELKMHLGYLNYTQKRRRKEGSGFKDISIIFLDIDHFKKVNDTHGHDVGDAVLKKVAKSILSCFRAGDVVARWGGEEFVATLLGAKEEDAFVKAEEVRQTVEKLRFLGLPKLHITISAGIATCEKGLALKETVKHADQALYKAKNSGRNKVVLYSSIKDGN